MAQMVVGLVHEEDGNFGISFPDFPGAVTAGKSADEAMVRGRATLAFHVQGMIEDKEALPDPRSIGQLMKDRDFREDSKGAAIVMVPLDLPGKSVRVNITMDEHLIDAVDRAAGLAGSNRSAFLADAARARLLGVTLVVEDKDVPAMKHREPTQRAKQRA